MIYMKLFIQKKLIVRIISIDNNKLINRLITNKLI